MAKSNITVKVEGLSKVLRRLDKQSEEKKQQLAFVLKDSASNIEEAASNDAPEGVSGLLRASISVVEQDDLTYDVICPVSYAPYVEFGTKGNFRAIPGVDSSQFKGKGEGSAEEFLESIKKWVRLEGIKFQSAKTYKTGKRQGENRDLDYETTAYFIYHFIMLNGIKPHPFFFDKMFAEKPALIKKVKQVLGAK